MTQKINLRNWFFLVGGRGKNLCEFLIKLNINKIILSVVLIQQVKYIPLEKINGKWYKPN
ncbi:MAG: hypothetical protein A2527_02915 [Candidatus Lambdaproteobacteria bacterium RIFOXYD2_FULL_50_16]|uniref:Uncharacterized protein n=1 Tax=Candidatus Lambdaproteobacteria bacterium RIFOXYD2_FULL_50_16 TaxID=1817772 RepID=A0A1F6GFZ0_9PROT|nr:MAG: hypothetical protein A2527_02915 [Candidatus Lambdaproteobacteria bacterium RIFOXYD2_FULL_50_16]